MAQPEDSAFSMMAYDEIAMIKLKVGAGSLILKLPLDKVHAREL